jgi:hypothetical protein
MFNSIIVPFQFDFKLDGLFVTFESPNVVSVIGKPGIEGNSTNHPFRLPKSVQLGIEGLRLQDRLLFVVSRYSMCSQRLRWLLGLRRHLHIRNHN